MELVKETLYQKWSHLTQTSLIALREMLLSWDVVTSDANGVVHLLRPKSDASDVCDHFFIRTQIPQSRLNFFLEKIKPLDNVCLTEFLSNFTGLGETEDGSWGFVAEEDEPYTLQDIFSEDFEGPKSLWDETSKSKRDYELWKDAHFFYHAGNGDLLFLHPCGKVFWWEMAEMVAHPAAETFAEFIELYVEFRSLGKAPDSYTGPWKKDPFQEDADPFHEFKDLPGN